MNIYYKLFKPDVVLDKTFGGLGMVDPHHPRWGIGGA